jgi:hypothetical protein
MPPRSKWRARDQHRKGGTICRVGPSSGSSTKRSVSGAASSGRATQGVNCGTAAGRGRRDKDQAIVGPCCATVNASPSVPVLLTDSAPRVGGKRTIEAARTIRIDARRSDILVALKVESRRAPSARPESPLAETPGRSAKKTRPQQHRHRGSVAIARNSMIPFGRVNLHTSLQGGRQCYQLSRVKTVPDENLIRDGPPQSG